MNVDPEKDILDVALNLLGSLVWPQGYSPTRKEFVEILNSLLQKEEKSWIPIKVVHQEGVVAGPNPRNYTVLYEAKRIINDYDILSLPKTLVGDILDQYMVKKGLGPVFYQRLLKLNTHVKHRDFTWSLEKLIE